MVFLKKVIVLIVFSVLFSSCDDVVVFHVEKYSKIRFIEYRSSTEIIVSLEKSSSDINEFELQKLKICNKDKSYERIGIKECRKIKGKKSTYSLKLEKNLENGCSYVAWSINDDIVCYVDFIYIE